MTVSTGRALGMLLCRQCGKVITLGDDISALGEPCPRCYSKTQYRKTSSIQRTWALLIASVIAFIPANVLPVMTVVTFGRGHPDTIMSGVIMLLQADMLPIALVVFVASVLVPVFKLLGLFILLLAVHYRWRINYRQATIMYRYIHFIGRWSMLDLFMISILVTLVNMGNIAAIHTGPGATAFATVVVLTMLAASSFDPRILWDLVRTDDD